MDVRGWDRNEVQVTGHLGDDVERVDVESSGGRTVIKVVLPRGSSHDGDADARSAGAARAARVEVCAVSADVSSRGVLGTQRLKSVSGEITADIAGDEFGGALGERRRHGARQRQADSAARELGERQPRPDQRRRQARRGHGQRRCARAAWATPAKCAAAPPRATLELRAQADARCARRRRRRERRHHPAADGARRLSAEIESFSGDITGCLASNVERVSKYGPGVRLNIRTVRSRRARARQDAVGRHRHLRPADVSDADPRGRHRYNVGRVRLTSQMDFLGLARRSSCSSLLGVRWSCWLVDPNSFKPRIEAAVREATGREFTLVGDIELGFFPWLALRTGEGRFGNPPGFRARAHGHWQQRAARREAVPAAARRAGGRSHAARGRRRATGAARGRHGELAGHRRRRARRSQCRSPRADSPSTASRSTTAASRSSMKVAPRRIEITALNLTTDEIAPDEPFTDTEIAGNAAHGRLCRRGRAVPARGAQVALTKDYSSLAVRRVLPGLRRLRGRRCRQRQTSATSLNLVGQ